MIKIRMITYHTPKNYGAVWQAVSLFSYLKHQTDDVKVIDFCTKIHKANYAALKLSFRSGKAFALSVLALPHFWRKLKKNSKFDVFIHENLELTQRYDSAEKLYCEQWENDVVFTTGSDQVFRPNLVEEHQKINYLDFVPENHYKFSYAASFGVRTFPNEKEKKERIAQYLKKFNAISIREKSGVEFVRDLCGREAVEVLDPVFLNERSFWENLARPYLRKFERYLLYYRLLSSRDSDRFAMRVAKERNLKLIVVGDGLRRGLRNATFLRDVGPQELLTLYRDADFVTTTSFHGVALSLIFEKQFVFSNTHSGTNIRGLNLLEKAGILEQAVPKTYSAVNLIDYQAVNARLTVLKRQAKDFIDASLEEARQWNAGKANDENRKS